MRKLTIDFHCHFLPGIDDGAADVSTAANMLKALTAQNVSVVAATPHYTSEKEAPDAFLKRREQSLELILAHKDKKKFPEILPGAEVSLAPGISQLALEKLCIGRTKALLIELPMTSVRSWMVNEIEMIAGAHNVIPMIAHLDRYSGFFTERDYEHIFSLGNAYYQINASAFRHRHTLHKLLDWDNQGIRMLVGTDAHNMKHRPPDYTAIVKALSGKRYEQLLENIFVSSQELFSAVL